MKSSMPSMKQLNLQNKSMRLFEIYFPRKKKQIDWIPIFIHPRSKISDIFDPLLDLNKDILDSWSLLEEFTTFLMFFIDFIF